MSLLSGPSPNIYDQQTANRRRTIVVMAAFTLFVAFLGFGFDVFILGVANENGIQLPIATAIALIGGAGTAIWSLENGAQSVLRSSTAQPVPPDDPRYQQLRNVTEEMAIASGLPVPKLFVIPDPDANAFATGKDPEHACIAVTEGLLEKLGREELQAVVAHELAHVRNYDIRMMTVVAALIGATMLLSEFGLRTIRVGKAGRKRSPSGKSGGTGGAILFVMWIIALILAPVIAQLLSMAVSRQREYLADASGAELTRNPQALASALRKIDDAVEPTGSVKRGTGHLCIADPLGRAVNAKEGAWAELFATHPPMRRRIALLEAMAYTK